jgi:hypothetical protein
MGHTERGRNKAMAILWLRVGDHLINLNEVEFIDLNDNGNVRIDFARHGKKNVIIYAKGEAAAVRKWFSEQKVWLFTAIEPVPTTPDKPDRDKSKGEERNPFDDDKEPEDIPF